MNENYMSEIEDYINGLSEQDLIDIENEVRSWDWDEGKEIYIPSAVQRCIMDLCELESDEERAEVFAYFCKGYGIPDPESKCCCMRDD